MCVYLPQEEVYGSVIYERIAEYIANEAQNVIPIWSTFVNCATAPELTLVPYCYTKTMS